MKKLIYLTSILFFVIFPCFSQKIIGIKEINANIIVNNFVPTEIVEFDCQEDLSSQCNLIRNKNFIPSSQTALDPFNNISHQAFNFNLIPNWQAASGSATLFDGFAINLGVQRLPPPPATGYVFMAGFSDFGEGNAVEGITQHIYNLETGSKYLFSFFEAYSGGNFYTPNFALKIKLYHCPDFNMNSFPLNGYQEPIIPGNFQEIYCEIDPNTSDWKQTVISFIANDNYNAITVTPSITTYATNNSISYGGGICFAYPELMKVDNFNAGTATLQDANCMVTIGPSTPNLSCIYGTVFTWIGPNGQNIPAPANQQISIDVSNPLNVGNWTLSMSVPNATTTFNSCSENNPIISSIVKGKIYNCFQNKWPKAYLHGFRKIVKYGNGDLVLNQYLPVLSRTYNQFGLYEKSLGYVSNPNSKSSLFFKSNGISQFFVHNTNPSYPFGLNGVQLSDNSIRNSNGAILPRPNNVPINEIILLELGGNNFLTTSGFTDFTYFNPQNLYELPFYGNLNLRINTQVFSSQINDYALIKYNPLTNKLFVVKNNSGSLLTFSINGSSLNLISQSNYTGEIIQISKNDEVYFVKNGFLYKSNYLDFTTPILVSNVPNFINSNLLSGPSKGTFNIEINVDNNFTVVNSSTNMLYSLDVTNFLNIISQKIDISNLSEIRKIHYCYENSNIYLAFNLSPQNFTLNIGNQVLPNTFGADLKSVFTKLSLINDFSFSNNLPLGNSNNKLIEKNIIISPNPTSNHLKISISELKFDEKLFLSIKNKELKTIVEINNFENYGIFDISKFTKGIYYLEIRNKIGSLIGIKEILKL